MDKKERFDLVYAKVKEITRTAKSGARSGSVIKDKAGVLLTKPDELRNQWKEYIEDLYCLSDKPKSEELGIESESEVEEDNKGPELLGDEIRTAIKELRKKKAVGVDEILADFLKILGEEEYVYLEKICKKMYVTGSWPEDFTKSIMIPLLKKPNASEYMDHRTISLISHASTILLHILTNRVEARAKHFIGKNQFSFRKGCGTRMQ
jgi:hypothetical protein